MNTPRTDALLAKLRAIEPRNEVWDVDDVQEFLRHSRQLETELAAATALIAKSAEQMKSDRESNEQLVDAYIQRIRTLETELQTERGKVAKLRDALKNTMGHIWENHMHWKDARKALEETK
jgi:predicted  nucleic acid-binding Zn-ribbon protein